jgi:hypothetical protein
VPFSDVVLQVELTVQTLRSPRRRRSRTRERRTVPVLTDIPIGLFTSATVLDFLGRRRSRAAVNGLTALGLIGTVPTAAAGLADWSDTHGEDQRMTPSPTPPPPSSSPLRCSTASRVGAAAPECSAGWEWPG